MCGRFTQKFTWSELIELYRLTQPPQNLQPSYNVCPTDPVSVIIPGETFPYADALAVDPEMVEEVAERTPSHLQCQSGVGCREADVSGGVQGGTGA